MYLPRSKHHPCPPPVTAHQVITLFSETISQNKRPLFFSEMNFLSGMNGLGFILVGKSENDIHIFSDPLVLFPMALVSPGSYAATHVSFEESYLEVVENALSWSMLGMNALYKTNLAHRGWWCTLKRASTPDLASVAPYISKLLSTTNQLQNKSSKHSVF